MSSVVCFSWKAMLFSIISRHSPCFASTEEQVMRSFKQPKCGSDYSIMGPFYLYSFIFNNENVVQARRTVRITTVVTIFKLLIHSNLPSIS